MTSAQISGSAASEPPLFPTRNLSETREPTSAAVRVKLLEKKREKREREMDDDDGCDGLMIKLTFRENQTPDVG